MKFHAPLVRIYFNIASDAPRVWSIDFGAGTVEMCAADVILQTNAWTRYDHKAGDGDKTRPDLKTPRAWLEAAQVMVHVHNNIITLTPSELINPANGQPWPEGHKPTSLILIPPKAA